MSLFCHFYETTRLDLCKEKTENYIYFQFRSQISLILSLVVLILDVFLLHR